MMRTKVLKYTTIILLLLTILMTILMLPNTVKYDTPLALVGSISSLCTTSASLVVFLVYFVLNRNAEQRKIIKYILFTVFVILLILFYLFNLFLLFRYRAGYRNI